MSPWPISAELQAYLEVQYDLERVLGRGGMGVVLLGRERTLDRHVAIKVLSTGGAADQEMRDRFRREARIAARLTHPNIVPLHSFGEVGDELFFVMGYVEGESLAERLERERRLDEEEVRRILGDVADALGWAHASGVVHRDVKPENVLLEARSGRVLLTDFGIARETSANSSLTSTGVAVGTPHYMAPEQASSDPVVDHRADLYALGVMGYRMLAGRLPFEGGSTREILLRHVTAQPAPLDEADEASPRLAAALMRCLEKEPGRRWPDAGAFRAALDADEPSETLPPDLAPLEGLATRMGAGALATGWLWWVNAATWGNEILTALLPAALVLFVAGVVLSVPFAAKRHGLARAVAITLRPPRFWPLGWPEFAQRPGDVWARLPRLVRWGRTLLFGGSAMLAILGATFLLVIATADATQSEGFVALVQLLGLPVVVGFATSMITGFTLFDLCLKRHSLSRTLLFRLHRGDELATSVDRLIGEPTASPRWREPALARFLEAPSRGRGIPAAPERLHALIRAEVKALARTGVLPDDSAALVAAEVLEAIEELDREIDVLARVADPKELAALEKRIASLSGGERIGAEMREMLERQREALQGMLRRQAEHRARRERLLAQMRELFLALEEVKKRAGGAGAPGVTERIGEVCDDLRRLAVGYDELAGPATVVTPGPD